MKPRIAKITGTYGTEAENGVGRFLSGLFDWSLARGYPLHIFASGDHVRNYPGVRNVHALSFPVPGGFHAVEMYYPLEGRRKQFARAVRELQPDVVHVSTPEAMGMAGLWIARKLKRPVAGIYHTDFPAFAQRLVRDATERLLRERGSAAWTGGALGPLWKLVRPTYTAHTRWWERWLLGFVLRRILRRNRRKIDDAFPIVAERLAESAEVFVREALARFYGKFQLVLARSEIYREKLIRELHLHEDQVRSLRRGVDSKTFSPEPTSADERLRERFGIPAAADVVLYVGRVTDEKNVGFLADAWQAYRRRHGRAALVVAGGGNLEEFRRRAGAGVYTLGPCHGTTLSAVYRLADVFWTASTTETLGQVVLEALASGVPVIVSDRGAARESVEDGRSGLVLPADSPERWARALEALLGDGARRAAMACAARIYAEAHTIEESYRHYWALHEELLDRQGDRAEAGGFAHCPGVLSARPAAPPQGRPSTHLSDFHVGKRSKHIPKEAALRSACRRAATRGARVFLQGDFLDTRPALHKFRAEVAIVRRTFAEFGIAPELYLEGNHDYEFGRSRQIEALLGCRVAPSLVHYDIATGLVLTHGHVSELPGLESVLQAGRSRDELIGALSVDRLKEALKLSALRYDLVDVVTNALEAAGLRGLEELWRHGYSLRRWLADRLLKWARKQSFDDTGVKAVTHMIGSSDREEVLSQLCVGLGGWGLVYGHTHEPHVTKQEIVDPLSGKQRTLLLGNSGSFRRKSIPPTWIEAAFPCMELWAYSVRKDEAELLHRISLSPEEAAAYHAPLACPSAARQRA